MRQIAGAGVVIAVAVAAMRIVGGGAGETPSAAPAAQHPSHVKSVKQVQVDSDLAGTFQEGCTAFDFSGSVVTYPHDANQGAAKSVLDHFFLEKERGGEAPTVESEEQPHSKAAPEDNGRQSFVTSLKDRTGLRFVVALAPDPRHTNLSLIFDREMVAIQQAAQDEGYNYNSSWLPWTADNTTYAHIADQQRQEDLTDAREACPGVLLFRKSVRPGAASEPGHAYNNALIVLVVGEQPTGGINESQWSNAIAFLHRNASVMEDRSSPYVGESRQASVQPRKFTLLGPTFTGSLPSLERDLFQLKSIPPTARVRGESAASSSGARPIFPSQETSIQVLGTSVRGCSVIRWFQQTLYKEFGGQAAFGSLEENDSVQIYNFLNYLNQQGTKIADVAILSEDETAYANSWTPQVPVGNDSRPRAQQASSCDFPFELGSSPVRLSYPRDISALRSAYEKQSVFTGASRAGHSVLDDAAELTGEPPDASDTIPSFGNAITPVNQEAVLYGIVSNLRSHHSRYLLLRCTNPLDFLFLIRFFHRAYPEGRIVTVGSDLFFRREIDTTEFRGTLALSSYSLVPREQHWSHLSQDMPGSRPMAHTHRIPESDQEAAYLAARFLFDRRATETMPQPVPGSNEPLLILPFKENMPDFADPFWLHKPGDPLTRIQPPTWLSVVGRDGYWPVAVLNSETTPKTCLNKNSVGGCLHQSAANLTPPSTLVRVDGTRPIRPDAKGAHYDLSQNDSSKFDDTLLFKMDRPWELCTIFACLLLAYQVYAISQGREHTSFGLFAPFRPTGTPSHNILLGINCGLALTLLSILLSVALAVPQYGRALNEDLRLGIFGGFWLLAHIAFSKLLIRKNSTGRSFARWAFAIQTGISDLAIIICFFLGLNSARIMPLVYRMGHLTEGVSPLVPPLFLVAGCYLWIWQALAGNAMLCGGRPLLPELETPNFPTKHNLIRRYWESQWYYKLLDLPTKAQVPAPASTLPSARYRISEEMGKRILKVAAPLCLDPKVILLPLCLFVGAVLYTVFYGIPLLSLEGLHYDQVIDCLLLLAFVLTIAEAARLFMTWKELQRLLTALGRLRLRRTFAKLHAINSSSIWSVSGNVQRVQYHFFAQQLDAAKRLATLPGGDLPSILKACRYGVDFGDASAAMISTGPIWEAPLKPHRSPHKEDKLDDTPIYIRQVFNDAATEVLNRLFIHWETETTSLCLGTGEEQAANTENKRSDGESGCAEVDRDLARELIVRTQEEFVCLHYIAFIQNILARMRTMILSMTFLFVSVCLSISFYPFVPRTGVSLWMLLNLVLIGSAVVYVYAGMERDATLSHITNTRPGSLGTEFYVKTATFLAGPVIGLLTTQFPAISESILSILQPGLDALK